MKSINSLVNFAMLKNNVKRFWILTLFYFLFTFLLGPFIFLMNKNDGMITSVNNGNYEWFRNILHFDSNGLGILFFTVAFAFVLGIALNSHMTEKGQMVFVHSLPTTKLCNYVTSFVTAILLIFTPIFINCCLMALLKLVFGFSAYRYVHVLYFMLELGIAMLLVYSFTALIGTICGTKLFTGMLSIFFGTLPMLIYISWLGIGGMFVEGYSGDTLSIDTVINLSPFIKVFCLNERPFTLISSIIYILVSFGMIYLGYLIYKTRKNEKATEPLAFEIPKPVLKYLITALMVFPMTLAFAAVTNYSRTATYIGAIFGIFVGYFVTEMFIQKNLNVWNKWKGFAISLVAFVLVVVVIKTGAFGYVDYIPEEDEIEAVLLGEPAYDYDWESNKYDFLGHYKSPKELSKKFSTDEEYIKLVREYHKSLIENCDSSFMYERDIYKHDLSRSFINDEGNIVEYKNETIIYKLKNGRLVERRYDYDIYKTQEAESKVKSCTGYKRAQYNEILDIFEGKNTDSRFVGLLLESEIFGYDWQIYVEEKEDLYALLDAYLKDYFNSTYDPINTEGVLSGNIQFVSDDEIERYGKIWDLNLKDTKAYDEAYGYAKQYYGLPKIDSSYVNLRNKLEEYGWSWIIPSSENLSEFRLYKINNSLLREEEQNGFSIGPISWNKCTAGTSIDENVLAKYPYVTVEDDDDMFAMTSLQRNLCGDRGAAEFNEAERKYMDNNYTYIAYLIIKPEYVSDSSGYTELLRVSEDLIPGKYIAEFETLAK